jgi:hypothetical protein
MSEPFSTVAKKVTKYYLKHALIGEREVTKEQYIEAERQAGLRSKWEDACASSAFGSGMVNGFTRIVAEPGPDKYPEHTKLKAIQKQSQAVGEFLEWLNSEGFWICKRGPRDEYWPTSRRMQSLLAEHFEIDENKIDAEKEAMIEECRAMNDAVRNGQAPTP